MREIIIALAVAGLLLVIIELFIPGMVAGAIGIIALIAAIVLSYTTYGAEVGSVTLVATLILGMFLFIWWLGYFPRSYFGKKLSLDTHSPNSDALASSPVAIGSEGKALTSLRPAGVAVIDGRRVDVVSEGPVIDAEQPVRVLRVEGAKIVVRRGADV